MWIVAWRCAAGVSFDAEGILLQDTRRIRAAKELLWVLRYGHLGTLKLGYVSYSCGVATRDGVG